MTNPTDPITYVGWFSEGLTKREYFAAMAMQALISNGQYSGGLLVHPKIGDIAIEAADALINALNTTAQ